MIRRRSLALATLAATAAPLRAANDVASADAKAVRALIEAQLAAFASDDANKAYSYAAPGIQTMFGSADRFLAMVRESYPVVYRPASVAFLQPEWIDGKLVQRVQMSDAAGAPWLVVYELEAAGRPHVAHRRMRGGSQSGAVDFTRATVPRRGQAAQDAHRRAADHQRLLHEARSGQREAGRLAPHAADHATERGAERPRSGVHREEDRRHLAQHAAGHQRLAQRGGGHHPHQRASAE